MIGPTWTRLGYDPAKAFDEGTELAVAECGPFQVYEVREWRRDGDGYYASSRFEVRREERMVFKADDYPACFAWCRENHVAL